MAIEHAPFLEYEGIAQSFAELAERISAITSGRRLRRGSDDYRQVRGQIDFWFLLRKRVGIPTGLQPYLGMARGQRSATVDGPPPLVAATAVAALASIREMADARTVVHDAVRESMPTISSIDPARARKLFAAAVGSASADERAWLRTQLEATPVVGRFLGDLVPDELRPSALDTKRNRIRNLFAPRNGGRTEAHDATR